MTDETMRSTQKPAKKSEKLEVRIPYETKRDLLAACREDRTTASDVVRRGIDAYLDQRQRPQPQTDTGRLLQMIPTLLRKRRYLAIGAAGAFGLAGLVALPSAAQSNFRSVFDKLDANHDGVLTAEEFAGPRDGNVVVVERHKTETKTGEAPAAPSPAPQITQQAIAFWLPDDPSQPKDKDKGHDGEGHDGRMKMVVNQKIVTINKDEKDGEASPPIPPASMDFRKMEFDQFDTDHDGKVSFAEYQARQTVMLTAGFELLDANHDGFLGQAEYARIASPPMPRLADGKAPPIPGDTMKSAMPGVTPASLKARFKLLDKNHDGKLSLQEYLPPA